MNSDEFARNLADAEVNLQAMARGIRMFRSFFEGYFRRRMEWRVSPGGPEEIYFVSLSRLVIGNRITPGGTEAEPVLDYLSLSLSSDFKLYLSEVHCFRPSDVYYVGKPEMRDILKDKIRFERADKIQGQMADMVVKLSHPITAMELLSETIGFHIQPNSPA